VPVSFDRPAASNLPGAPTRFGQNRTSSRIPITGRHFAKEGLRKGATQAARAGDFHFKTRFKCKRFEEALAEGNLKRPAGRVPAPAGLISRVCSRACPRRIVQNVRRPQCG
jgi:hypothetical protein